jgi:hypothetical protein
LGEEALGDLESKFNDAEHLLSPPLSSMGHGGEGGRRPGEEALGDLEGKYPVQWEYVDIIGVWPEET